MQISLEVCDVCHDRERSIVHYRVAVDGDRLRTFALCEEHSAPIRELVALVPAPQRRPRRPFADMKQVEAARKPSPAKRTARRKVSGK